VISLKSAKLRKSLDMEKPNLDRIWETYVKLGQPPVTMPFIFDAIRTKLYPMLNNLTKEHKVK